MTSAPAQKTSCSRQSDCPSGQACYARTGHCVAVECTLNSHCGAGRANWCLANECRLAGRIAPAKRGGGKTRFRTRGRARACDADTDCKAKGHEECVMGTCRAVEGEVERTSLKAPIVASMQH